MPTFQKFFNFFNPILKWEFNKLDFIAPFWVLLILVIFLFFIISLECRICLLKKTVDKAMSYLVWSTPEDIEKNYEEINMKFNRDNFWMHNWREYDEYLVKSPDEQGNIKIFSPNDAYNFFVPQEILDKKINIRIFNSVQATLTTLGILGTFVGLTFGLQSLSDAGITQQGINYLIKGMYSAFLTSIVGMSLGVIFGYYERKRVESIRFFVSKVPEKINALIINVSSEKILFQISEKISQQNSAFKSFSVDLADRIRDNLSPHLSSIQESISKQAEVMQKLGSDSMQNMLDLFKDSLLDGAADQFNDLSKNLGGVIQSVHGLQGGFSSMVEKLNSQGDQQLETLKNFSQMQEQKMSEYSESMASRVNQFTEITNIISDKLKEVAESVSESQRKMLDDLTVVLQKNTYLVNETEKLLIQFKESMTNVKNAGNQFTDITNELQSVSSNLVQVPGALENQVNTLQEAAMRVSGNLEATQSLIQGFEGVRKQLEEVFISINQGLTGYSDATRQSLERYLNDFDKQFSNISTSLSGLFREIEEPLEELPEKFQTLSVPLQGLPEKFQILSEMLDQFPSKLQILSEPLQQLPERIQTMTESINAFSRQLVQSMENNEIKNDQKHSTTEESE